MKNVNYDLIESYRNKANDSYGVLASVTGMHESGVRRGIQTKSLKFSAVKLIADHYDVPVNQFITGNKSTKVVSTIKKIEVTTDIELKHALEKIKLLEAQIELLKENAALMRAVVPKL